MKLVDIEYMRNKLKNEDISQKEFFDKLIKWLESNDIDPLIFHGFVIGYVSRDVISMKYNEDLLPIFEEYLKLHIFKKGKDEK